MEEKVDNVVMLIDLMFARDFLKRLLMDSKDVNTLLFDLNVDQCPNNKYSNSAVKPYMIKGM